MIFADRRGFSGKLQFQEFRKFQEFDVVSKNFIETK